MKAWRRVDDDCMLLAKGAHRAAARSRKPGALAMSFSSAARFNKTAPAKTHTLAGLRLTPRLAQQPFP